MRALRRDVLVACSLCVLSACFAESPTIGTDGSGAGTDGSTGTADTSGSEHGATETGDTDASDTGSQSCECVPAIPEGWEGPVTVVESEAGVPSCPSVYPGVRALLHAELDAPAAACTCDCERAEGTCTTGELAVHTNNLCIATAEQPVVEVVPEQCTELPIETQALGYVSFLPDVAMNASCPPRLLDKDIPESSWGLEVAVCEGASVSSCGGGELCVPASPPVCIFTEGEQACPDAFPNRTVRYEQVDDGRDCDCTCQISNARCAGMLSGFDSDCAQTVETVDLTDVSACHILTGTHVIWEPSVLADCLPSATTRGQATPLGATTICCRA